MSLNILLGHSKSLKVIRNDTVELRVCKSLLLFHWHYVCISYRSEIFSVKNGVTLKLGVGVVQGHWKRRRSIDRAHMTLCWSAIVNIALSCTVFELFDVGYCRDLEIWVRGHSKSFKLVPFESLDGVSFSTSTYAVIMAEYLTVYEIFSVKVLRDLENLVKGCSRLLKMAPFDRLYMT